MGFFDLLGAGLKEAGKNTYREMSKSELEQTWERVFRDKDPAWIYNEYAQEALLDAVYGERISHWNWKRRRERYLAEKEAEKNAYEQEQERKKQAADQAEALRRLRIKEEEKRRERELDAKFEAEKQRKKFEKALPNNEMVKNIIEKINGLAYEAFSIDVNESEVIVCDENSCVLMKEKYVRYGYPNLTQDQKSLFNKYLAQNLNLKYVIVGDYRLELNDAPGGMKASW